MTTPRITVLNSSTGSIASLEASSSRLTALQSQLSSGRQITKPSDDPAGTAQALALRGQLKRENQYQANAASGIGWLTSVDDTLTSVMNQAQSARTLVVKGLNSGTNDSSAMTAIANQLDQLRQGMISTANTTYEGRPIFGGTTAGTTAFDSTGAYVGDDGSITRTVADNDSVQVNQTGPTVFGSGSSGLFDVMSQISTDMRTNPSALSGDLSNLDAAMNTVSTQQAQAGATYQRIQTMQTNASNASLQTTTQLSSIQDVDVANMAIQISSANMTYQAALQTTASIKQTSLLDYLK